MIPAYAKSKEFIQRAREDKETRKAIMKTLDDELTKLRTRIKLELEKHPEVIEVEDLVRPKPSHEFIGVREDSIDTAFAPLIATFDLPADRTEFQGSVDRAERYLVVINGSIVIYAADASRLGVDFPSLRDKITEILQPVIEPEIVPPNTSGEILLLNGPRPQTTSGRPETNLQLTDQVTVKVAMGAFYQAAETMLRFFYDLRKEVESSRTLADDVIEKEGALLDLMRDFNSTPFHQIRKRHSINAQMHLIVAELLLTLSKYSMLSLQVSREAHELDKMLADASNSAARKALEESDWKEHVELSPFDRDAALSIIEQARSEMETSGMISATLWSALLGAIVGALVGALMALATSKL